MPRRPSSIALQSPPLALALVVGAALACAPGAAKAGLFGAKPPAPAASSAAASSATPAATPASPPMKPAEAKAAAEAARKIDLAAREAAERLDPLARATFWARESVAYPADPEPNVRLSAALRTLGRYDEAAQAVDKVLISQPTNEEALLEAARARIGADQGFYAVDFLTRAQAVAPGDWRVQSLLGVAYGQTKRIAEAKAAFAQALTLSPDNPAVLSNLALTLASTGETAQAEPLLRRAAASPKASAAERQNLALVLGLEGKLPEAETLIRRDLPPESADANLAYLHAANAAR